MPKVIRRTFRLTEEQAKFIDDCVSRDGYPSPSHVVQHALDDLAGQFALFRTPEFTELLKREVLPVLERIDRGEEKLIPVEEAFDDLEALLRAKIRAAE